MKFGPNHNNFGVKPEITGIRIMVHQAAVEAGVPGEVFATSGLRGGDGSSYHDYGFAEDYDSDKDIDFDIGQSWAKKLREKIGFPYDILWHMTENGEWHLHVEFDLRKYSFRYNNLQPREFKFD